MVENQHVISLTVYGEPMKVEETFKYLGDTFNSKGIMSPFVNIESTSQWDP